MEIILPNKKAQPNTAQKIEFEQLVILGANGAGKTRFGSDIEKRYPAQTHRISAQKSLSFPIEVRPTSQKRAEFEFSFGFYEESYPENEVIRQKSERRWNNRPNTLLLDDYEKLLVLLHTEEYEKALKYKEGKIDRPTTKLDRVQDIWEKVLPHRKLEKEPGMIKAYITEEKTYNASEMSDGERVIFYLTGQVICVPQNSLIIIDEPEMHIHFSLIKPLFDLLERERDDCSFIYITHNIDFAVTRPNAKKVWVRSYDDNGWDYEVLDQNSQIPEEIYFEILGSRNPVLFIEGDDRSLDYELYQQVYSNMTIKKVGSCEKVIQLVKAFSEQKDFHNIESFGIIDRDRRQDVEIGNLVNKGIWVLDVAEVENLLLIEEILKSVAAHMGKNPNEVFTQVSQNIISFFTENLEGQILLYYKEVLSKRYSSLAYFSKKHTNEIIEEIDAKYNEIDKVKIYNEIKTDIERIIESKDYNSILRYCNLKNALIPYSKVCELTGIKDRIAYKDLVINLMKNATLYSQTIKEAINGRVLKMEPNNRMHSTNDRTST